MSSSGFSNPLDLRSKISRDYACFAEYLELCRDPCYGIFVIPWDTIKWHGALSMIGGAYDGAIFRFEIVFSADSTSTQSRPKLTFCPPVFHPLVDPRTGHFDLEHLFPQWGPQIRIRTVLAAVKEAFFTPDISGRRNPEAASLYQESLQDYRVRVTIDILNAVQDFANENNGANNSRLSFGSWIPEVHEMALKNMLEKGKQASGDNSPTSGALK